MKSKATFRTAACILTVIFFLQSISITATQAFFGPKSGSTCSQINEEKKIKGNLHICSEAKDKKLRWLLNSEPTDKNSALVLVLSSCGSSIDGSYSVYVYPRMMFGALAERGIADGNYKPKDKRFVDYDIELTRKITSNFEMAAALDSKWKRINLLWNSGIDSAYARWNRGGVTQIEAIRSSSSNLDSIEGLCKIAFKSAEKEAIKENRTLSSWINRTIRDFD